MKYLLVLFLVLLSLFISKPVKAQTFAIPTFYCYSNMPCTTISPSQRGGNTPSFSPGSSVSTSPSTSQAPGSTSPNPPCTVQIQNVHASAHAKNHAKISSGFIRKFFKFLLQLILLILQQLGISIPNKNPQPSPNPSSSPAPSTNPCPSTTSSVSPAPSGMPSTSVSISPGSPTSNMPPTNCQPNAILVNPCRVWVGAAANGNPGVPGQTKPGSDKISQFDYLEQLIGHPLDIFRDYDGANTPPLNSNEMHFATRPNTYIDINWKPAANWASAGGSNATVNAVIDRAAASIKAIAPHKVFFTVWHEPQNDVSAFDNATEQAACNNDPKFKGLVGHAGTPAQYIAMWQNVQNRFKTDGATNVVWVMNYMSDLQLGCLVKPLWPGSNLVDWVEYDTYDRNNNANNTWDTTVGAFYAFLRNLGNSDPSSGILSKPWGLGEFGTCKNSSATNAQQYYIDGKNAYLANKYPNLKMYLIYADTGNSSGYGCLTEYDANFTNPASNSGPYDPTKQQDANQFFGAILNSHP